MRDHKLIATNIHYLLLMARANVIAPPFSLILGCLMNGHTHLFNLEKKIKSKPFNILAASNVIGALTLFLPPMG